MRQYNLDWDIITQSDEDLFTTSTTTLDSLHQQQQQQQLSTLNNKRFPYIHERRAKIWSSLHVACSVILLALTTTGHILLRDNYTQDTIKHIVVGLSWFLVILSIVSTSCVVFFVHFHDVWTRTYGSYMLMRTTTCLYGLCVLVGVMFMPMVTLAVRR